MADFLNRERDRQISEALRMKEMFEEAGAIVPYHRNYVDAIANNVKGMPRVPLAAFGGAEFPEFVWLS